jgi:cytochrome c peroxidase
MNSRILALALCLLPLTAEATVITEAPWLPRAAAYRLTLFLGNLTPVPWDQLTETWNAPVQGAEPSVAPLSRLTSQDSSAVTQALATENRQALFAAATMSISRGIISHLNASQSALGTPEAARELAQAEALFRAIEDGIQAADPTASRRIGIAWLTLSSALGSTGLSGVGMIPADTDTFASAQAEITDYLRINYLPETFLPRAELTSAPESALVNGVEFQIPARLPPGSIITDQAQLPRLVLQFEEAGLDEADLPLVAYGDMLFDSPVIFGGPARDLGISCSTCHNRSDVNRDFFIPGLSAYAGGMDVDGAFFNPLFNDRADDHLDTPSLRGIRFTAPYGRDGREASLRRFTRNVIVTEFAGAEPTAFQLDALIAYMRQFDFLPNPQIDRQGNLTEIASEAANRGEVLFNTAFDGLGGNSCASCHRPDRDFRDGLTYDIGSAAPPFPGGTPTRFETPTLRNINFSAPYMHDGSLPTLASVVAWFDDTRTLGFSDADRADLTAYLEAVGDGEAPYQNFAGRESVFRLAWEELTTFASTLNTLIPEQDAENIAILVATVAPDLAADASIMVNQSAKPQVYALAGILIAVGEASAAGDWSAASRNWQDFEAMQADIDERMY